MAELKLWCCIERDPDYFQVSVLPSQNIYHLKKQIHDEAGTLQCRARELTLTKVDVSLASVKDAISSGKYQPNVKDEPLSAETAIFKIWSEQPSDNNLHVFVRLPSLKRQRLDDEPDSSLAGPGKAAKDSLWQFWKSLWLDKVNPFSEVHVRRDPNPAEDVDVPATMKVLRLPVIFPRLYIQDVMVRDEYAEAIKGIESLRINKRGKKGVIIVGHPGIGKTIFLYYILVNRLLENKPTVLQNSSSGVFIFNDKGCYMLEASSDQDYYRIGHQDTWALVDLGEKFAKPADVIVNSSFFLVMASSPQPTRWKDVREHRGPAALWFMKPFSLAELIQARQFQEDDHKEADIENFYEVYGPSARACYTSCDAVTFDDHYNQVRWKVSQISWDELTRILALQLGSFEEMDKTSHTLLLVEPDPKDRSTPRTRIVTKAVSQVLWDRDSDQRWQNHHQLFKTVRMEPRAKSFLGDLFEPAFHALCIRGASLKIYPITDNRRAGPTNYTFANNVLNESKSETLTLHGYRRLPFNTTRPISNLVASHYYQPTTPNHPSYDSFIYDANSHQISAFQVTVAVEHDLLEKGVIGLRDLGKELQINDLKIRIILVVLEDAQVSYKIKKHFFHELGLEVYVLQVTEDQLYSFS